MGNIFGSESRIVSLSETPTSLVLSNFRSNDHMSEDYKFGLVKDKYNAIFLKAVGSRSHILVFILSVMS